eukprot:11733-Heterococcus_DN1.PRE.4
MMTLRKAHALTACMHTLKLEIAHTLSALRVAIRRVINGSADAYTSTNCSQLVCQRAHVQLPLKAKEYYTWLIEHATMCQRLAQATHFGVQCTECNCAGVQLKQQQLDELACSVRGYNALVSAH